MEIFTQPSTQTKSKKPWRRCWLLMLLSIWLLSCSKELHTTKQVIKNKAKIEALANKLFDRYYEETFFGPADLDSLELTWPEMKLITKKLKCPYIHIIYDKEGARFFEADSVVLFTRTGLPFIGKQHNVIVDMQATKRDSIPVDRAYLKYYKVTKGIYYIQDLMPAF